MTPSAPNAWPETAATEFAVIPGRKTVLGMTQRRKTGPKPALMTGVDARAGPHYKPHPWRRGLIAAALLFKSRRGTRIFREIAPVRTRDEMANTTSARKATRKIARRTEINKTRRSLLRNSVRKVEEAIASGDRTAASAALKAAEPVIMRAAQRGVVHKNNASRKVSRLANRVAQLGK
jgi:small subunit ribosomal protein S20